MRILAAAFAFMLLIPSAAFAVQINEIMYNPAANNNYAEWIEVWNDGSEAVDMTGWRLCNSPLKAGYITYGSKSTKPTNDTGMMLPANGYAIITDGTSGSTVLDNFTVDVNALLLHVDAGSMCGGLNNPGDTVTLTGTNGVVDNVTYTNIAKKDFSIERDSTGWFQSLVQKGTPGYVNSIIQQGSPPEQPQQPVQQEVQQPEPVVKKVTTPAVSYANKIVISLVDAPAQATASSRIELGIRLLNDFPTVKDVIVSVFLAGQNPSDGYTYTLDSKETQIVQLPAEIGKAGPTMLYARVSDGSSSWTIDSPLTVTAPPVVNATEKQLSKSPGPSGAFTFNFDLSMFGQLFGDFWSWITGFFSSHELPRSLSG